MGLLSWERFTKQENVTVFLLFLKITQTKSNFHCSEKNPKPRNSTVRKETKYMRPRDLETLHEIDFAKLKENKY